jgi:D-methionine transport system substrate-binding protein
MRTRFPAVLAAAAMTAMLAACGGGDAELSGADEPLRVGASPVPHAEILRFIDENLAEDAGLDLEIQEFTDYIQPNVALDDGSLDANYFQTIPYLEQQEESAGYDFQALEPVHIEPLGIYAETLTDLAQLPDGATVAIPNDPTNAARALRLLEANDLITLAPATPPRRPWTSRATPRTWRSPRSRPRRCPARSPTSTSR